MKSLRIIYCTVLAAMLSIFALGPAQAQGSAAEDKPYFPDVPKEHWAYNAVQRLVQVGIIEGYPSGAEQTAQRPIALPQAAIVTPVIKSLLVSDSALKNTNINVDTTATSVTLSGVVKSREQKLLAGQIARQKAPHFKIINNIKVVGSSRH